jgi:hypothetical protein
MQWLESILYPKLLDSNFILNYFFIHEWNGWKKILKLKKGSSCSPKNNHVSKGDKA